jgi:hypothetical protein
VRPAESLRRIKRTAKKSHFHKHLAEKMLAELPEYWRGQTPGRIKRQSEYG